jgi:hypothetical protein
MLEVLPARSDYVVCLAVQNMEHLAFDTVNQVIALGRGKLPRGAVNADRWTQRI